MELNPYPGLRRPNFLVLPLISTWISTKLKNSQWRIFQHSNHIHLLDILDSYILPILTYGSSLWIFQVFPEIRLDLTPKRPYGETFNDIQRTFNRLLSACAAARKNTSHLAILVRLGRLPLHYHLALYAMCDFHAIVHKRTGPAMTDLLESSMNDLPTWNNTLYQSSSQPMTTSLILPSTLTMATYWTYQAKQPSATPWNEPCSKNSLTTGKDIPKRDTPSQSYPNGNPKHTYGPTLDKQKVFIPDVHSAKMTHDPTDTK